MDFLDQLMRLPYMRGLWFRFPLGSIDRRVQHGIFPRPHYAFGLYWAALQAQRLGIARISAIEFGVAGGRGLVAMESAAKAIAAHLGVAIDVFGFDSGEGLPEPVDYRDLPHIWGGGFYQMDVAKLRSTLTNAQLVLGMVEQTVPAWLRAAENAPLGFIAFDLDYYSSTKAALEIFNCEEPRYLPRVYCYFDDVKCMQLGCMNPYVGELLAIREYNDAHATRKICLIEQLRVQRPRWEIWQESMYAFHDFSHSQYNRLVVPRDETHSELRL